mmetsp:Transcript_12262/g.30075  ORF Transcript_12262/g.30075 Transcript_12262/m.30075 type:complete len:365 (-) Transcript_12262:53-1147(-)
MSAGAGSGGGGGDSGGGGAAAAPPAARHDAYEPLKVIGKGYRRKVLEVRHKASGERYAMKVIRARAVGDVRFAHAVAELARGDVHAQRLTPHPFVATLREAFHSDDKLVVVTTLVSGGELFLQLQKERRFDVPRARFYAAEVALALAHLHAHGVVHGNVKPEQVLLDARGHAVLTDCGWCGIPGATRPPSLFVANAAPEYLPPEVLLGEERATRAGDFYALGALLYEMLTGLPPYYVDDRQQLYELITRDGAAPAWPDYVSRAARDVIERLLVRDAARRMASLDALRRTDFFAVLDFDALLALDVAPPFVPPPPPPMIMDLPFYERDEPAAAAAPPSNPNPADPDSAYAHTTRGFEGFTYVSGE